jgi:hypothetical protein
LFALDTTRRAPARTPDRSGIIRRNGAPQEKVVTTSPGNLKGRLKRNSDPSVSLAVVFHDVEINRFQSLIAIILRSFGNL